MDQKQVGKRIAQLRRREGLTQQQLGELLGVTNKTVSRWENGNYMPDIDVWPQLGKVLHVSVDALLETDAPLPPPGAAPTAESPFTFEERKAYYIKKWRQDHIGLFILLGLLLAAFIIIPIWVIDQAWISCFTPLLGLAAYGWQNNQMMIYVESRLYGD